MAYAVKNLVRALPFLSRLMSALPSIGAGDFSSTLLRRAKAKQHGAFLCLVEPLLPQLQRTARNVTGNAADAEDVRQNTLLRAYTRLNTFHGHEDSLQSSFAAWMTRIATNEAIDTLRRRRAGRVISFDDPTPAGEENPILSTLAASSDDPEQRYARMEMRHHLADAIEQLDPGIRRVCLLRDVVQLSTEETAEHLGISSAAVRVRLFRARLKLRERLRHLLAPRPGRSPVPARRRSSLRAARWLSAIRSRRPRSQRRSLRPIRLCSSSA